MKQFSFSYNGKTKEVLTETETLRAIALYREDVLITLINFIAASSVGSKIDINEFNYTYAPVIERVQ